MSDGLCVDGDRGDDICAVGWCDDGLDVNVAGVEGTGIDGRSDEFLSMNGDNDALGYDAGPTTGSVSIEVDGRDGCRDINCSEVDG